MKATSLLEYEQWKDIAGYEGLYQVSSFGRVRSLDKYIDHPKGGKAFCKGRILTGSINKQGYKRITLTKDKISINYLIHRLVAIAFIDNPYNYQCVNHIWENQKANNNIHNLEWCTVAYNNSYGTKLQRYSDKKAYVIQQIDIHTGTVIAEYKGVRAAAKAVNGDATNIAKACRVKSYNRNVKGYYWNYKDEPFVLYQEKISKAEIKQKKYNHFEDEKVIRYDFNGNVIKEYNSIKDASTELNTKCQLIVKCCRGELITSNKSIWRFKNDDFNKYPTERMKRIISEDKRLSLSLTNKNSNYTKSVRKTVGKYNLNNELVKTYLSVTDAIKENGMRILSVLNGRQHKTHGFIYKYL